MIIQYSNNSTTVQYLSLFFGLTSYSLLVLSWIRIFWLKGLGRIATLALSLGVIWGLHVMAAFMLLVHTFYLPPLNDLMTDDDRIALLLRWCIYMVILSSFHLLEFFTTAIYNPTVATSESFLVNHSLGYTGAFLTSTTEFWLRFLLFPSFQNRYATLAGMVLVVLAQILRSLAMCTAGYVTIIAQFSSCISFP